MPYLYKITYPNGLIYIGSDITDDWKYTGSPTNSKINEDLVEYKGNFVLKKEIIEEYDENITIGELRKNENIEIIKHKANDPKIGYNLFPKFGGESKVL